MKFGPERRVRKHPEFQEIQRSGRRVSTKNFVLIVARGGDPKAPSRLGITASKKVGNSVRRSRLKRLVREAYRACEGLVPPGHDVVVICKADAPELTATTVLGEWRSVSKKIQKALAQVAEQSPGDGPRRGTR